MSKFYGAMDISKNGASLELDHHIMTPINRYWCYKYKNGADAQWRYRMATSFYAWRQLLHFMAPFTLKNTVLFPSWLGSPTESNFIKSVFPSAIFTIISS